MRPRLSKSRSRRNPALYVFLFCAAMLCACDGRKPAQIEGMVYVAGGKSYAGSRGTVEKHGVDAGDGKVGIDVGVNEIPRHTVGLNGFYIDKYEVTNSRYKIFADATGRKPPDNPGHPTDPYIWENGTYPQGMGDYPVTLVDYEDAQAYCEWAGKRLPAEEEWEKACRGTDGRKWPWGDDFEATWANLGDLKLDRSAPVGAFPKDASPYGVRDMGGNVREWTSSWYDAYPGSTLQSSDFGQKVKVTKGGAWRLLYPDGRCPYRGTTAPERKHRSLGFRCAKDR